MPFFTLKFYLLRLQKRARRRVVRRRSRLIRVLLLDMVKRMRADKKKNDDRVRPSQAPGLRKKDDDKKMDDDKPRPSQAPFLRKKKRWGVLCCAWVDSWVSCRASPPSPLLRPLASPRSRVLLKLRMMARLEFVPACSPLPCLVVSWRQQDPADAGPLATMAWVLICHFVILASHDWLITGV